MSGLEKKFATKSKIVNYIINRESTSKVEISKELLAYSDSVLWIFPLLMWILYL